MTKKKPAIVAPMPCTDCGGIATERHDGADGAEHWWCRKCWLDFCAWLRGEDR